MRFGYVLGFVSPFFLVSGSHELEYSLHDWILFLMVWFVFRGDF